MVYRSVIDKIMLKFALRLPKVWNELVSAAGSLLDCTTGRYQPISAEGLMCIISNNNCFLFFSILFFDFKCLSFIVTLCVTLHFACGQP
jgi:hypothetical protein